jgi:Xaa-Pro aminopeptidase
MSERFRERVRRLQALMASRDVDLFVIVTLENYFYFSGDLRKQPRMLIPQQGEPALVVFANEEQEVRRTSWVPRIITYHALHEMMLSIISEVNRLGKEKPRIGLEVGFAVPSFLVDRFKVSNPTAEVVQERTFIEKVRKTKDKDEVEAVRKASELADKGMELVASLLKPGIRERDVAIELEYQLKRWGADGLGFAPFLNSGYRSLWLHGMATSKKIEKGEIVVVDFAPAFRGYHANISRTFLLGKASADQKEAMNTYLALQQRAFDALRPGRRLFEIEQEIEDLARQLPRGEHFVRGFVHGIGLAFEEFPFPTIFPEDIMEPLETSMTLSVGHPVLSVPRLGGFKQEDTILLTSEGVEVLTQYPGGLIEV